MIADFELTLSKASGVDRASEVSLAAGLFSTGERRRRLVLEFGETLQRLQYRGKAQFRQVLFLKLKGTADERR